MQKLAAGVVAGAESQVNALRAAPEAPADRYMRRHILRLATLNLDEDQLAGLEAAFSQSIEHALAWLFAVLDGNGTVYGWPPSIRLVDTDAGRVVCDGRLQDLFTEALNDLRYGPPTG
jgi:hypothetical protein